MSQEVFEITLNGETKWRCCNDTTGLMSLDDRTLEPLNDSLEAAVERLLDAEAEFSAWERDEERTRLLEAYAQISEYLSGRYVANLDTFFTAVVRITSPNVSQKLGLTQNECGYLQDVATMIRLELAGSNDWLTLADSLNSRPVELSEDVFVKLFPNYQPTVGNIGHPELLELEVKPLVGALGYANFLLQSVNLDKVTDNK